MTAAALHVRELGFTYRGARAPALDRIDLDLPAGEVLGLLGPSGAGKSTLQRILTGLLPGYRGSAQVLGAEASAWGRALYERIGVAFETPISFGRLTLRENLRYFAGMYDRVTRDPDELLEAVGLLDDADTLGAHLSKGMGVRLNLARALLTDPELLFLDEPTSGLDPARAARVEEIIDRQRRRGGSVVVTTHDMVLAERACDRVGFIVDGRLVEVGRGRARPKLQETEKHLSGVLYEHGVDSKGFAMIRSKGDQALFHLDTSQMKRKLGVPANRPVADFLPTISIKAKDFAAEMTHVNVQQKALYGESEISREHVDNNAAVRQMMIERGIVPENLPPAEDVKKVERRLAAEKKKALSNKTK